MLTTNYKKEMQTSSSLSLYRVISKAGTGSQSRLRPDKVGTHKSEPEIDLRTITSYTPCPWSGGYPVDTGGCLPAGQQWQSCSRSQLQGNSSSCWFSPRSGPAEGSTDMVEPRQHSVGTMQPPNELPCLGAAALTSQSQEVLRKRMWNMTSDFYSCESGTETKDNFWACSGFRFSIKLGGLWSVKIQHVFIKINK